MTNSYRFVSYLGLLVISLFCKKKTPLCSFVPVFICIQSRELRSGHKRSLETYVHAKIELTDSELSTSDGITQDTLVHSKKSRHQLPSNSWMSPKLEWMTMRFGDPLTLMIRSGNFNNDISFSCIFV